MKQQILWLFIAMSSTSVFAQRDRWQQQVKYTMDVNMDVTTNRFSGKQQLEYTNNSPDTLYKVFYHLYFNAFQPNSMMDVRSRELGKIVLGKSRAGLEIRDWDPRVTDRISKLNPDEIGYQKIISLKMNGVGQQYKMQETILEVNLTSPIMPGAKTVFDMQFEAQVPLQIRRSGRDNSGTGVRYSMAQWYPKLCEYDYEGWHPTPYIAREFYGVWGDFEVNITIDKSYIIAGTGYLQNANQIGYGYETPGAKVARQAGDKLTWHFSAPNVHDFVWAADPHYKHLLRKTPGGTTINVFYNADPELLKQKFDTMRPSVRELYKNDFKNYVSNWDNRWNTIADAALLVFPYIEKNFGPYPYKQFSFIHGGDGAMEYQMATLLNVPSVSAGFHEWMHSWYQGMLGTNESEYAWMDEGFTSYAE
ncbi:MAG: M1 family metallopeptidase, partial [Chitinophagaceae bacterium]